MKSYSSILLLTLLSGCAIVGQDYEAPETPTATEGTDLAAQREAVASLARWWEGFNDPVLTEFITQGLESSPTVAAAQARLRASRATREQTEAGYWPQFTASGSYTWSRGWGGSGDTDGWNKQLGASVDASWELDLFGGVRRSVEQAAAQEAALAYTLQDTRTSLAAEIASAYVSVRRTAELVRIAERNLEIQQRNLQRTQSRYDTGEATRYDLVTSKAQVAQTQATIPTLRADYTAALLQLDWLTGNMPYATRARIESTTSSLTLPTIDTAQLPNELLRRRADLRSAEAEVHAQTAAIGVAEANLWPRLTLGGAIGLSSPDLSPWSSYTRTVNFGPAVSWNVFGFSTWQKQVESAKATLDATIASYIDTVLQAYQEAETALDAYRREMERTAELQATVEHYTDALAIATKLNADGETDISDVLTQESNLLSAEQTLITHKSTLIDNTISLYKALGGGWLDEVAEEQPLLVEVVED